MRKSEYHPPLIANRRALLADEHGPGAGRLGIAPRGHELLRVALVYPNDYSVGMSSLGFQIAWRTINEWPGAAAERFFIDTMAGGSLETGTPLAQFDVIAISAAYEMDDPHVLDVLAEARLPLAARQRSAERCGDHALPLVVLGGVLASVNRLPLYPFVDVICHGEAEIILPALLAGVAAVGTALGARADLYGALAGAPGIEVTAGALAAAGLDVPEAWAALGEAFDTDGGMEEPAGGDGTDWPAPPAPEKAVIANLGQTPFTSEILTPRAEFNNMALVDLARGCPHHCTFCWIGHNAPAYRVRPLDEILEGIMRLQPYTDKFGLVASAVGAHPQIDELCRELMAHGLKVSYSSLRVEEVSETMLRALAAGGGKTVTIAPEAGALRVRRLLGKRISDEQIFAVAEQIFGLGAENMKLYFMIGIPSETDEEALEIAVITEKIRQIMLKWGRPRGRIGSIGVNLGIFVPKAGLPLNHIEPVPFAEIRRRLKLLVRALARVPNTHVNVASPELARAQAVLSMGGIEAARFVMQVRALNYDWRAAVRAWDRRHDAEYAWRFERARLSAKRLQIND